MSDGCYTIRDPLTMLARRRIGRENQARKKIGNNEKLKQ